MRLNLILVLTLFAVFVSCNESTSNTNIDKTNSTDVTHTKPRDSQTKRNSNTTEIICDSIYKTERYKIVISRFSDEESYNDEDFNSIFKFSKWENEGYKEVYTDSIQQHFGDIQFIDFNNDNVKDIMIGNISDARSNWSYYLYLMDSETSQLKKIKNFKTIKNPHYLPKHNLIDNMVWSGRNWTSFYKLQGDSILDSKIVIYDGEDDNGKYTYEEDYEQAINQLTNKNLR